MKLMKFKLKRPKWKKSLRAALKKHISKKTILTDVEDIDEKAQHEDFPPPTENITCHPSDIYILREDMSMITMEPSEARSPIRTPRRTPSRRSPSRIGYKHNPLNSSRVKAVSLGTLSVPTTYPMSTLPSIPSEDGSSGTNLSFQRKAVSGSQNTQPLKSYASSTRDITNSTSFKLKSSFLTRSKTFQSLVNWSFDQVDTDGSGTIDKKELYAGLLLIHLHLAVYAGPAACEPITRECVEEMFDAMDVDDSGDLDKEEFLNLMMVMCSQILTRVAIQWALTLMIVPFCARRIVDAVIHFFSIFSFVIPFEAMFNQGSIMLQRNIPIGVQTLLFYMEYVVPDEIFNGIPVTLTSCLLGIFVVPWTVFNIDSMFKKWYNKHHKTTSSD